MGIDTEFILASKRLRALFDEEATEISRGIGGGIDKLYREQLQSDAECLRQIENLFNQVNQL